MREPESILVVIESPFAGDIARNILYARRALQDSIGRGEAPYASHLLYPQILDDDNEADRETGITAGLLWAEKADLRAFYVDRGMSAGMYRALRWAMAHQQLIEFRIIDRAAEAGETFEIRDTLRQAHRVPLFAPWKPPDEAEAAAEVLQRAGWQVTAALMRQWARSAPHQEGYYAIIGWIQDGMPPDRRPALLQGRFQPSLF